MGEFVHQSIRNGDCIQYRIDPDTSDLDVFVERIDFGQMNVLINLCDQRLTTLDFRFSMKKEEVSQLCKSKDSSDWTLQIEFSTEEPDRDIKVEFLVQERGNMLLLPDGLAFRTSSVTGEVALGFFAYDFLNIVDTRVILRSYSGRVTVYAKVIDRGEKLT